MATKKKLTFEQTIQRLEEIVSLLEKGDVPLEQSIALFEEGTKLSSKLHEILENAEQKVQQMDLSSPDHKDAPFLEEEKV